MPKIEIDIPSDLNNKNSVFSHCLSFLKNKIGNDDKLEGKLKALGNTELISEKHIALILGTKLNKLISTEMVALFIREYKKEKSIIIRPVKNYSQIGNDKVYLKEEAEGLIEFIENNNSSK